MFHSTIRPIAVLVLLGATACGSGDIEQTPDAGTDAAVDQTSEPLPDPYEEEPSIQSVTITVRNDGTDAAYVATSGTGCDVFAMEASSPTGWAWLPLSLSGGCGCNLGCDPITPSARTLAMLESSETLDDAWDARAYVTWSETVSCGENSSKDSYVATHGVLQPVAPGRYRVTIPYFLELPEECTLTDDTAMCPIGGFSSSTGGVLCPTDERATAEFDLPPSGDANVTVVIGG